jgi:hypothetical protein
MTGLWSQPAEPPEGTTGSDHWVAAAFLRAIKPRKTAAADATVGWSYVLSLKDLLDPCGFTLFSDEHGVIYEAYPPVLAESPSLESQAAPQAK